MEEALISMIVIIVCIRLWELYLEKSIFKFLYNIQQKFDEWKSEETVEIIIDPNHLGPALSKTIKKSKIKYFEDGRSITKEKYYKIASRYIEGVVKIKTSSSV